MVKVIPGKSENHYWNMNEFAENVFSLMMT